MNKNKIIKAIYNGVKEGKGAAVYVVPLFEKEGVDSDHAQEEILNEMVRRGFVARSNHHALSVTIAGELKLKGGVEKAVDWVKKYWIIVTIVVTAITTYCTLSKSFASDKSRTEATKGK